MDFIYCNGVLTIQGDYGNCSFCWHNKRNTIKILAGFAWNLGYFLSKLESAGECSFGGTFLREFDTNTCIKDVENHFKENKLTFSKNWKDKDNWKKYTSDHFNWMIFCREHGREFFQDEDYWNCYSFGIYTVDRAYLYAYGLIKAMEFLEKEQNKKQAHCPMCNKTYHYDEFNSTCAKCGYVGVKDRNAKL